MKLSMRSLSIYQGRVHIERSHFGDNGIDVTVNLNALINHLGSDKRFDGRAECHRFHKIL